MKGRRKTATVVTTLLAALVLALPGTAAARSYSLPAYDAGMYVDVSLSSDTNTLATVSWSD